MNGWLLSQVTAPTTNASAPVAAEQPATSTQAAGTSTAASQKAPAPPESIFSNPLIMFIPIAIIGYFFMTRGPKKDAKKRKDLLESIKRGDEVETIGGLYGKVVDVKDDRVVIKIDESTNVRAAYNKDAIRRVVTADDKDKADDKK